MKNALLLLCPILMLMSCDGTSKKQTTIESSNANPIEYMDVKDKSFEELFQKVDSSEIKVYLAKLMVQEDHTVITAGTDSLYNSMAASWEVLGRYFQKPTTFCLLGANRYTLEFIRKQQAYTMSFFPAQFTGDVMAFGSKSGRNSDKMKETKLTSVQTPAGNMTYKEANVVIECSLFEITTTNPNDFYTADGKKFVEDAHNDSTDYHKLVFGTITNVWVRKQAAEPKFAQPMSSNSTIANGSNTHPTDAASGATALATDNNANSTGDSNNKTTDSIALKPENSNEKSYHLIGISLATLIVYFFTSQLSRRKIIKKITHRKIWNSILLIAFLVSGLLGLFLVFRINYPLVFPTYHPIIGTLHVEFGIVMALVSIIHAFWHLDYYRKLFKNPIQNKK